jgi:hypothetical protein
MLVYSRWLMNLKYKYNLRQGVALNINIFNPVLFTLRKVGLNINMQYLVTILRGTGSGS